jgi:hypothetical protein
MPRKIKGELGALKETTLPAGGKKSSCAMAGGTTPVHRNVTHRIMEINRFAIGTPVNGMRSSKPPIQI